MSNFGATTEGNIAPSTGLFVEEGVMRLDDEEAWTMVFEEPVLEFGVLFGDGICEVDWL